MYAPRQADDESHVSCFANTSVYDHRARKHAHASGLDTNKMCQHDILGVLDSWHDKANTVISKSVGKNVTTYPDGAFKHLPGYTCSFQ